jgi:hypothetical protein
VRLTTYWEFHLRSHFGEARCISVMVDVVLLDYCPGEVLRVVLVFGDSRGTIDGFSRFCYYN